MSGYSLFIFHVNRKDQLLDALNSSRDVLLNLAIIDNSESGELGEEFDGAEVIRPSVPLSWSQSMNFAFRLTEQRGGEIMMYMHSDAIAEPGVHLQLVEAARTATDKWGAFFTSSGDVLSAHNLKMWKDIGPLDTTLPMYFSDNDYYRRMGLAGWSITRLDLPVKHIGSQTIYSSPELLARNHITFPLYQQYYAAKWGGNPGSETFTTPFNR
jgi:hypothetical protein